MREKFSVRDIGMYADGALGHDHCRYVLAMIAANVSDDDFGFDNDYVDLEPAIETLKGDMSDDAWEETLCLDYLNTWCEDSVVFMFREGDLILQVW